MNVERITKQKANLTLSEVRITANCTDLEYVHHQVNTCKTYRFVPFDMYTFFPEVHTLSHYPTAADME